MSSFIIPESSINGPLLDSLLTVVFHNRVRLGTDRVSDVMQVREGKIIAAANYIHSYRNYWLKVVQGVGFGDSRYVIIPDFDFSDEVQQFLTNGGFTTLLENNRKIKEIEIQRESEQWEKLQLEIIALRSQVKEAKYTRYISIAALIVSIISAIVSILK